MKPSYRKEKDNDYMILEAPGKPEGGEYQIRMLLVNPIYGLLPCKMRMVDGSRAFYYDITEKQPMTSVFERRLMGKEDIEKLLGGLEKAMDEAGRYLLVMEQFILKPEYIFQDTETGEFFFCYLPFYDGSLETDFRELAEYILKRLDHSQEEAVLWGYDIYSRSAEEHFSIGKILESVHERAAKEAVRKSREKSPEKMRQTAPREERQKPVEELEYIEVEEGASEETARPAAGRAESRPVEKTILREGKAENTEKTVEREKPEKRNTEARREAWAAEKKKKHLFGKKQDKNIENRPKKSKGRKSVEFRAEFWGRRKQFLQVFIGMTASVAAAVWAVVCQGLNFIQAGGILFLCMGLLVYFTTVFQKKPAKKATSPEEEVLLWEQELKEDGDKTVFLGSPVPEKYPVLVSMDPGKQENIVLDRERMTVGKQKEQVDIFLQDPSVSRIHASLEKRGEDWYLRDRGSTNGTFLDGLRLEEGEKKKLLDGAEISFSGRRFYFHSDSTGSTVQN